MFLRMLGVFRSMSKINERIHVAGGANHGMVIMKVGGSLKTDSKRDVRFGFIGLLRYNVSLSFF